MNACSDMCKLNQRWLIGLVNTVDHMDLTFHWLSVSLINMANTYSMCLHVVCLGISLPSCFSLLSPPYLPTTPNLKSSTTCTLCCFLSPICSLHSPLSNKGWKGSRETDDIINLLKTEKCLECKVDACCHVVTFFFLLEQKIKSCVD